MSYGLNISPRIALAIVATTLGIVAACSDQREPTSPAARVTTRAATADVGAASLATAGGQAKPTDQVGFTKITLIENYEVVPLGGSAQIIALCPIGSTVTGGGFSAGVYATGKPIISHSRVITVGNQNGWSVGVENTAVGAAAAGVHVHGLCAS